MSSIDHQIRVIRDFAPTLRHYVDDLTPEHLVTSFIEGEWTIAQVVHHLFDAHTNAYQLCKRVLSEENAGLSWPQQDVVADLPDGCSAAIEPSLVGLTGLHARWADMFAHVNDWQQSGTSLKSGKMYTIADLLRMYANHCDNHIEQIKTLRACIS